MKRVKLIAISFFLSIALIGQKTVPKTVNVYAAIDKKALEIPDSLTKTTEGISSYIASGFQKDSDKVRAIFIWVATNIQYDFDNMFAINFYEPKEEKIAKPLRTKKGICENYAALFNDICSKTGIKSFVVQGYTKQDGFTDYIPHAWVAAFIDSSWFLFDPTWGSGYVSNGKFYKKINNNYFKVAPATLIKSHMPFDFLWQFLNYPVSNQEFYEGNAQVNKSKPFFNYADSIRAYEKQTDIEQLMASYNRIERNGIKNSMIFDRLYHIKSEIENYKVKIENSKRQQITNLYNSAVIDYNDGIKSLNDFSQYRNNQFIPKKTDPEIKNMIDTADNKFKSAKSRLNDIKDADGNTTSVVMQLNKAIDDAATHVKEQQDWLKIYFSKGKGGRKSMFYKYTWFGIPIK